MTDSKTIALFGGSFNPPHLGHLAALQELANQNSWDELWILPVYHHPFRKELLPYEHRLAMLKILLSETQQPQLKICEIEKELNQSPSYTYNTVMALKKKHPNFKFRLLVGTDVRQQLSQWYKFDELQQEVDFFWIRRKGYEESALPEISSTTIREKIKNKKSITDLVPLKIQEYIEKHHLYE